MFSERKASYKAPPSSVIDIRQSQQARREKALEEQKRRRARKVDASRQLDLFADLTLGPSDDEADENGDGEPEVVRSGVASFASLLPGPSSSTPTPSTNDPAQPEPQQSGKKKPKKRKKRSAKKANKWADKCMYAELLEMDEASPWSDGLPDDLETGFVAVAPVPVGKRCLAVTHQSAGYPVTGPNTTLRSRLQGKSLMPPFPSPLPPSTILDCILDSRWQENGILHVLDVIQWKGQEVGECETAFRFWWRDTRLSELPPFPPPPSAPLEPPASSAGPAHFPQAPPSTQRYRFPHPATLIPIPYHPSTSVPALASHIIPAARSVRHVTVQIPSSQRFSYASAMDIDMAFGSGSGSGSGAGSASGMKEVTYQIPPDGLLLYVAQASYEPGTSPLSSWVPLRPDPDSGVSEGALDVFERLVRRRLAGATAQGQLIEVDMDAD